MSTENKRDYVAVTYRKEKYTSYPDQLAEYVVKRYGLKKNEKLLDLGCGRGEYLKGFVSLDIDGYGIDQSTMGASVCPGVEIVKSDLVKASLPYDNNYFDIIFSKSVLEHFYYPEKIVKEMYRVLKPGGIVISMVPDWEAVYRTFYVDYTHRTPFTINSFEEIFIIHGFDKVKVEKFRQLPFLWSFPFLKPFCSILAFIMPRSLRPYSKLVRFSQEVMLFATAIKPDNALREEND